LKTTFLAHKKLNAKRRLSEGGFSEMDQSLKVVTSRHASGRRRRSSRKKQKIVSESGAIMPSVLLTYQGGLFTGENELYLGQSANDSTDV